MKTYKKWVVLLSVLVAFFSTSQQVMTYENYKFLVLKNHPFLQKAYNVQNIGATERMKAKGFFDPAFGSSIEQKKFAGNEYYWMSSSSLKLPTWVGATLKSGYDANRGDYLSKEMYIPSSGLWYMGVELPLGQGLLFDERRAQLKQAKIAGQLGAAERKLIINDLALDAFSSYWLWVEAYRKVSIAKEGVELAKQRLAATQSQVDQGESPSIDTVEALMQFESRSIDLLQSENQFKNTSILTELYLWTDSLQPAILPSNTVPQDAIEFIQDDVLDLQFEMDSLPLFQQVKYKVDQLEVELKWKREQLKPTLNLGYNLLTQPIGTNNFQSLSPNNYKFGMTAYVPLLLRKERASFKQAKLKLENATLDVATKKRDFQTKIQTLKNEIKQMKQMQLTQMKLVEHSKSLRDSEQIRFESGESSLFLVNAREVSYLSAKLKLVEIEIKLMVNLLKLKWLINDF